MRRNWLAGLAISAGVSAVACLSFAGHAAPQTRTGLLQASDTRTMPMRGETTMSYQAKGTFEPTVTTEGPEDKAEGSTLVRWVLSKKFQGDLQGTSAGQGLAATTSVKGSAGYVAIERVTGTLGGKHGSFVLQHSGIMSHGAFQLDVSIVPDSGNDQLAGIAGTMKIQIAPDGTHSYELDYKLPAHESGQ